MMHNHAPRSVTPPPQRFRILRTLDTAGCIAVYYDTREERWVGSQQQANEDGAPVLTELWAPEHPQDALNRGWAMDGLVQPTTQQ